MSAAAAAAPTTSLGSGGGLAGSSTTSGGAVGSSTGASTSSPSLGGLGSSGGLQAASVASPDVGSGPGGAAAPKRAGGGVASSQRRNWSEVCQTVQHSDGSVRTSPPFKSGAAPPSAASATVATAGGRPRAAGLGGMGIGKFEPLGKASGSTQAASASTLGGVCSSRGGSSRGGSSGKSSRSSSRTSRDPHARDADESSRCSSGGGWDTSTNSSGSRPRTPEYVAPSPAGAGSGLAMPDPIRTKYVFPTLLDGVEAAPREPDSSKGSDDNLLGSTATSEHRSAQPSVAEPLAQASVTDPCGRDGPRRSTRPKDSEWSAEPLAKYIKSVAAQIEANLQNHFPISTENFDKYVFRVVANTHRQMRHAPRKAKHSLEGLFSKRLEKFWHFMHNKKLKATTPEELRLALCSIVEALVTEFSVNPDIVAQPRPTRRTNGFSRHSNGYPAAHCLT
eukprot:TRINITY_DN60089_c1_g1_i1.p2 TRINITY_DN60089_c1_g1~~TRINITY_DN60089_c1_g1_i1.p2  ORF type:complete len:449 (-),score=93.94 TRINITY_DN60089_c1_g1_i1:169-1515(-)